MDAKPGGRRCLIHIPGVIEPFLALAQVLYPSFQLQQSRGYYYSVIERVALILLRMFENTSHGPRGPRQIE